MRSKEGPHVEVLNAILAIKIVQCSALAQCYGDQSVAIVASSFGETRKERCKIALRNFSETHEI